VGDRSVVAHHVGAVVEVGALHEVRKFGPHRPSISALRLRHQ
jgi:hypothetical protein